MSATSSLVVDDFLPSLPLRVSFYARGGGGAAGIAEGAALTPAQVQLPPLVRLEGASADKLYALLLSDPDAPSVADPKFGEFLHFAVVNCPGADFASGEGDTRASYFGSSPGPGSGAHRYCLVVYEQAAGRVECDEPRVGPASGFAPRRCFKQRVFAAKYGLVPVASRTWTTEFSSEQPYFAAKVQGLPPPEDAAVQ